MPVLFHSLLICFSYFFACLLNCVCLPVSRNLSLPYREGHTVNVCVLCCVSFVCRVKRKTLRASHTRDKNKKTEKGENKKKKTVRKKTLMAPSEDHHYITPQLWPLSPSFCCCCCCFFKSHVSEITLRL